MDVFLFFCKYLYESTQNRICMLFNSLEFLLFLPVVFIVYWMLGNKPFGQNLFIVAASYVFYGWWDYSFLFLIMFTTLCSFASGIFIDRYRVEKNERAKIIAGLNIVINLSILILFKYYNFFAGSLADAFSAAGIELGFTELNIILPVGISFYTFQALSYSIDVYRGNLRATRDIVAFFAYIAFFPQLVAGPIERATNLLPQFCGKRYFEYSKATDGLRQALWGFFMKVVVADNCALGVNNIFLEYRNMDSITLIFGALLFSVQIYCDFAGYSNIAIGVAKLFGINLMENFKFPYFSRDISEFWRKWHISLTTWFRDYIYIPLGGSRCGKLKGFRNTVIVFLTSGLWHGASWNFVVWGAYHALLFIPLFLMGRNRKYLDTVAAGRYLPSLRDFLRISVTFILVMFGWIIFRAQNMTEACGYIYGIFTRFEPMLPLYGKSAFVWIIILFLVEWVQREKSHALAINLKSPILRMCIYYAIILVIIIFQGNTEQFIYFRF